MWERGKRERELRHNLVVVVCFWHSVFILFFFAALCKRKRKKNHRPSFLNAVCGYQEACQRPRPNRLLPREAGRRLKVWEVLRRQKEHASLSPRGRTLCFMCADDGHARHATAPAQARGWVCQGRMEGCGLRGGRREGNPHQHAPVFVPIQTAQTRPVWKIKVGRKLEVCVQTQKKTKGVGRTSSAAVTCNRAQNR